MESWPILEPLDGLIASLAKGPENMGFLSLTPPLGMEAAEKINLVRICK